MTTLLQCAGLTARRGDRVVLAGIDLRVDAGEVVVLIGPNGAGKSTLLHVLAGLLPAAAGTVERTGRVAAALQAPALARRSALANVELALSWWGSTRNRKERRARARRALDALNAGALANRAARTLSGGEARRVHLARALAVEPDILLLDEPFAGLDPSTRADLLYDAASVLRSDARATVVVVHDRAEAWALADRVVVLVDGRVEASGSPADVFGAPPNERVAEFVGFTGRIAVDGGVLRFRPRDVALDANGPIHGVVERRVPVEDGVRLEVAVPGGTLVVLGPEPGPAIGDAVRLRVGDGVRYEAEGGAITASEAPTVSPTA